MKLNVTITKDAKPTTYTYMESRDTALNPNIVCVCNVVFFISKTFDEWALNLKHAREL